MAKEGKLLCLFKRPGCVALINPAGDLVVRPSECPLPPRYRHTRSPLLRSPGRIPALVPTAACAALCRQRPWPALPCLAPGPQPTCRPCHPLWSPAGFLEHRAHRSSVRSSVAQHLLTAYNASLAAVLRGQHEGKGTRCARRPPARVWGAPCVGRTRCGAHLVWGAPCVGRPLCAATALFLLGCTSWCLPGSVGLLLTHAHAKPARPRNSGGPQAMALLAAHPATRELLLRPLAIRPQSLRRFLVGAAPAAAAAAGAAGVDHEGLGAAGSDAAAAAAPAKQHMEVVVEEPADGADEDDAAAGGPAGEGSPERQPSTLRRLATTLEDMTDSIFKM